MNIDAIRPNGPTIAIEHQAFGEQPVNVTPEGAQPAEAAAAGGDRKVLTNGDFAPPIHAIRVKSAGKDWVTDIDATLTVDKIRGFSLDDYGVHVYSLERDIHGAFDNINVPYENLDALIFYFRPQQEAE